MSSIDKLIEDSISAGTMSRKEHDWIMHQIQKDGEIDQQESAQLSRLFTAVRCGDIEIVEEKEVSLPRTKTQLDALEEEKKNAVLRDTERKAPKEIPLAASSNTVSDRDTDIVQNSDSAEQNISLTTTAKQELNVKPTENVSQNSAATTKSTSAHYAIEDLLASAHTRRTEGRSFALQNDRMLDVRLNGMLWMKTGAMVGYQGIVKFTREGVFEHGVKKLVKKAVTGEGASLTKATGQGNLYLADRSKKISVVDLMGHTLVVNGTNLLAFEETVSWDITFLKQFAAIWQGGLFNVRMGGDGMVALTSFGDPLVLRVSPHEPVMTDMNATVAWSGSLAPQFKTDIAMKSLVGRLSGETVQMKFEGEGFVLIQPYEEIPGTPSSPDSTN